MVAVLKSEEDDRTENARESDVAGETCLLGAGTVRVRVEGCKGALQHCVYRFGLGFPTGPGMIRIWWFGREYNLER